MNELIQEAVAVRVGVSGTPARVVWRGRDYKVVGRPVPWIDRLPWWTWTAERLPQVVEQPMWTVSLAAPDGGIVEADLSVTGGDWWQIEQVRG